MTYLRWIPVTERMPDIELREYRDRYGEHVDREFIVFINGAEQSTMLTYDGRGFYLEEVFDQDNDDRDYYDVTHWMVMPPAPWKCLVSVDLDDDFKPEYELLEVFLT